VTGRPPTGRPAGLVLRGLTVGYPGGLGRASRRTHVVLQGLDLRAEPGRVTVLLGPNGAGKSTLLRTIAALQRPLRGRVEVEGTDVAALSIRDRARRIAVVLTDRFDPGLLTGGDVVALGRHPHVGAAGVLSVADHDAIHAALAIMHAGDLAGLRIAEMSDGQRQRVMVARALAQEPRLLVLDEPSAFLDAPARVELMERLAVIAAARGITVVLSTHDVESALRTDGDAWLIGPGDPGGTGGTVSSGVLAELAESGAINAAFDTDAVSFDRPSGVFRLR
jgi:iron complex transport system ATP-binding protein